MKFYELPQSIQDSLFNKEVRPYIRVCVDGVYLQNRDILDCEIKSYKSEQGGIVNFGDIVIDNSVGQFTELDKEHDFDAKSTVEVWFCFGNDETCFLRHVFLVDENGVQYEETGTSTKIVKIHLVDYSTVLNNKKIQFNWEHKQTFVHCVVCDKSRPEKSLVHLVAARAGFTPNDIDCGFLPFEVPYVEVDKTAWTELCDIAGAYNANLECTKDKPLIFNESPYDMENSYSEESGLTLTENEITHYRSYNDNGNFANSIRLKYTHYAETERQELWKFSDTAFWYDENNELCYAFTDDSREICQDNYEAEYTAKDSQGRKRPVVYAEDVDDLETFKKNIITNFNKDSSTSLRSARNDGACEPTNSGFAVEVFDTTTYKNKAIIKLNRNEKNIALYSATIHGKAIISEQNFCVYKRDEKSIKENGQVVKNITNRYMSDDDFNGVPFCERRVSDFLEDSKKLRKSVYLTTSLCLCGARVGAVVDARLCEGGALKKYRITEIDFYYKGSQGFVTGLWLRSE